jgi:PIN domain nuclease of toxin-antitoxin system
VNLLLDTHVFLWSITSRRLSEAADAAFLDPDNSLYLSAASYWEICIKLSLGKLSLPADWRATADLAMTINGIRWLPIEKTHCLELLKLPHHHRDPFDRLLIAQARAEGLTALSADPHWGRYEVAVVW